MTQEEFKSIILRQFKEKGSAIRSLMIETNMVGRVGDGYFKENAWFVNSDFKLDIRINRIIDEGNHVRFDIVFKEIEDEDGRRWSQFESRDLSPTHFKPKLFYRESVEFMEGRLKFSLIPFCLTHTDYEFEVNVGYPEISLEYDLKSASFMTFDTSVYKLILDTLRNNKDLVSYLDYVFVSDDLESLEATLSGNHLSLDDKKKEAILAAFEDASLGGRISSMTKIIEAIELID